MTLREELKWTTIRAITNKFVDKDHQQIIENHFITVCKKAAESGKFEAWFWYGTEGGLPVGEWYTSEELEAFATANGLDYKPSDYNAPALLRWT
ncbi:MAG: hypothetical protein EGR17_06090 [Butyrivibrio crossotus]|mgnify:CR=1 FL=1|nr:hypothetical protein [Butyrivibrio crossotus]